MLPQPSVGNISCITRKRMKSLPRWGRLGTLARNRAPPLRLLCMAARCATQTSQSKLGWTTCWRICATRRRSRRGQSFCKTMSVRGGTRAGGCDRQNVHQHVFFFFTAAPQQSIRSNRPGESNHSGVHSFKRTRAAHAFVLFRQRSALHYCLLHNLSRMAHHTPC